jgi:hypothetical protein
MTRQTIATSLMLYTAIAAGACNRGETTTTSPEMQTQTAQPAANVPMTVAGCVKAGEAADTYVLTTARAEGSGDTATYELVGSQTANLEDHIGKRVEVSGTLEAQQEIASRATAKAEPADKGGDRATGTSGTPTVQTRTEIDIKRLSVSSIKPLEDKCEM